MMEEMPRLSSLRSYSLILPNFLQNRYLVSILSKMFIWDGAKLVPDAFELAKEKAPCIIFIAEIDAIGTKHFDSEVSGDREVQRTMLELLNQLDGFSSDERIKVIAATNCADILDPALMGLVLIRDKFYCLTILIVGGVLTMVHGSTVLLLNMHLPCYI